jgi:hypothetical protein
VLSAPGYAPRSQLNTCWWSRPLVATALPPCGPAVPSRLVNAPPASRTRMSRAGRSHTDTSGSAAAPAAKVPPPGCAGQGKEIVVDPVGAHRNCVPTPGLASFEAHHHQLLARGAGRPTVSLLSPSSWAAAVMFGPDLRQRRVRIGSLVTRWRIEVRDRTSSPCSAATRHLIPNFAKLSPTNYGIRQLTS